MGKTIQNYIRAITFVNKIIQNHIRSITGIDQIVSIIMDEAVIGINTGRIQERPEDTIYSFANKISKTLGIDKGRPLTSVFNELLRNNYFAKAVFKNEEYEGKDRGKLLLEKLAKEGKLLNVRGKLHGEFVEVHSRWIDELRHVQSTITYSDTDLFRICLNMVARLAEYRDTETGQHANRLGIYSYVMAKKIGMDEHDTYNLITDATLHDIGKVAIPDKILLKPGKLSYEEFEIMKTHAQKGYEILNLHPRFDVTRDIAGGHHEKWDGSGYPQGLSGEEIPIAARIVALTDVFDALVSDRPYKKAFSYEKAREIMKEGIGNHFDPNISKVFLNNYNLFIKINEKMKD